MTDSLDRDQPRPSVGVPPIWHALTAEDARAKLGVDGDLGLRSEDVKTRLERYGPNEINRDGGRSGWQIFLDQFGDVMLLMLIGVAIVSAGLDFYEGWQTGVFVFPKDAIAISLIVMLNGLLGYLQESKAEKALAALRQLSAPRVRVLRDGDFVEIDSRRLVPGDIMYLEAGTQISADGRLLEASNLRIQEAALTGEALAVNKHAEATLAADTSLGDRVNCVFCGTETIQGRGKVLVTATAMDTELGKIATLIEGVESEPTPLQQRMTQLGQVLVTGAMILVTVVVVAGAILLKGAGFRQLLEVSLSMAVAVVPEGLPAVITVTLALGTQRMVRRHALIRRLPAVETLGSVTTICSDKTGTLTQNKMVAQAVVLPRTSFRVTGEGYDPFGTFSRLGDDGEEAETLHASTLEKQAPDLLLLLVTGVLCNDAVLQQAPATAGDQPGQTPWTILGDPTEGGLLSLAGKANIVQEVWTRHFPRVAEIPFSSERKRMSTFVQPAWPLHEELFRVWPLKLDPPPPYLMFTKGSPELVLQGCDRQQVGNGVLPLTGADRDRILADNERLAAQGLRVLGFAYRPLGQLPHEEPEADLPDFEPEQHLIWLGLVGAIDATRPEAKEAVRLCRQAGIRPVMITGDHPLTARAIAETLHIAQPGDRILTGRELEAMGTAELESEVVSVPVYARVTPEHKLRIVKALQQQNCVVAMTGDGVNDAPALKQADIGIAMGITGTDVSKEASDMVLLDDNFASIVAATEEGRVVYDNIRRFVKYILGSNIGEVIVIASAPLLLPQVLLGGGDLVPLSPLQILWMNLVTDGLPALALAMEPATPDVMTRSPHRPNESIFARGLGSYMIRIGIVFAFFTIALMGWAYGYAQGTDHPDSWKTVVFTSLCISQMGHALAVRSNTKLIVEMDLFSNPYVLWSVTVTTLLQLALVYVPFLRDFFGTAPLDGVELAVCLGMSALVLLWIEGEKLFLRWVWRRR
jgi:Ca2+-transporting ATPase